jgi:hypothetical protein
VKHSRFKEFEHSPEFSTLELRDRIPDPSKEQTFTHRIWIGMRRCKVIIIRRPWISHAALLRFGERKLCLYWKQAGKVRLMSLLAVAGLICCWDCENGQTLQLLANLSDEDLELNPGNIRPGRVIWNACRRNHSAWGGQFRILSTSI